MKTSIQTLFDPFNRILLQKSWTIPIRTDLHLNRMHDWTARGKRWGGQSATTHRYWFQGYKSPWSQCLNKYKYDHREKKNKGWRALWLMSPKCLTFFHLCWFFKRREQGGSLCSCTPHSWDATIVPREDKACVLTQSGCVCYEIRNRGLFLLSFSKQYRKPNLVGQPGGMNIYTRDWKTTDAQRDRPIREKTNSTRN